MPTEPTAKKNKKKGNKSIKIVYAESTSDMPPWLSQYEDEDFTSSYHLSEELQSVSYEEHQQRNTEIQRLQLALNGILHHEYPSSTDAIIPYFTPSEIHEIMDSIRVASNGNTSLMKGCADFLYLMLTLEEEGLTSTLNSDEPYMTENLQGDIKHHSIMTRDVLVAAAFHYCDCVRARKAGVYDYARQALEMKHEMTRLPLATAEEVDEVVRPAAMDRRTQLNSSIEHYGEEITQIASGAATLKRVEILATTIKSKGIRKIKSQSKTSQQTNVDAEILRSFMVSLSEDWRALVIRSAACLYRLKGISDGSNVDDGELSGSITLSKSTISVAKDAFKIYAPIASRLGMQRLKSELENCAFKILYPRQYAVASSLYRDMDEMKTVVQVLTTRIEQLLRSDPMFAAQIQDVTVTSRVKEPYSLWKKMIRLRKQAADEVKKGKGSPQSPPSLKWVPDTIALRIVLSAARTSSLEDDESLRTREKLLCYYSLQLIENIWEESEANERKDYIKNPKPNGYQSLHYTAKLVIVGEEWPFEVQIRSEEMHHIAEFGVAAHWDYKHKPKMMLPAATQESTSPMLALPPSEQVATTSSSSLVPARKKKKKGRVASYIEALATSREAMNNVFVFLSSTDSALDGKIISVNSSAKVSDVLKQCVELDRDDVDGIDLDEVVIYQNGVRLLETLEKELSNGDVLTVTSGILDNI